MVRLFKISLKVERKATQDGPRRQMWQQDRFLWLHLSLSLSIYLSCHPSLSAIAPRNSSDGPWKHMWHADHKLENIDLECLDKNQSAAVQIPLTPSLSLSLSLSCHSSLSAIAPGNSSDGPWRHIWPVDHKLENPYLERFDKKQLAVSVAQFLSLTLSLSLSFSLSLSLSLSLFRFRPYLPSLLFALRLSM